MGVPLTFPPIVGPNTLRQYFPRKLLPQWVPVAILHETQTLSLAMREHEFLVSTVAARPSVDDFISSLACII